eukprot:301920_1
MAQVIEEKKRILLVVTNFTDMPPTEEEKKENKTPSKCGWYLPEVAHPYMAFKAKGYEIKFVSPSGGLADCDVGSLTAFANDDDCNQFKKEQMNENNQVETVKITDINDSNKYDVIFYAGGHGTMWDFPDNEAQNKTASEIYENGGIVSAVCHGPAALVNIKLTDGTYLIAGKRVTGFTNEEEDAVKKSSVMPFMLETALKNRGATFSCVKNWGSCCQVSERVVTGQNPASAGPAAKAIIQLLEKN